jgi:hypothetical protein
LVYKQPVSLNYFCNHSHAEQSGIESCTCSIGIEILPRFDRKAKAAHLAVKLPFVYFWLHEETWSLDVYFQLVVHHWLFICNLAMWDARRMPLDATAIYP